MTLNQFYLCKRWPITQLWRTKYLMTRGVADINYVYWINFVNRTDGRTWEHSVIGTAKDGDGNPVAQSARLCTPSVVCLLYLHGLLILTENKHLRIEHETWRYVNCEINVCQCPRWVRFLLHRASWLRFPQLTTKIPGVYTIYLT